MFSLYTCECSIRCIVNTCVQVHVAEQLKEYFEEISFL